MTDSKITTQSPVGPLTLTNEGPNLVGLGFSRRPTAPATAADPGFEEIEAQLDEYFAGRRRHFDLPYTATGPEPGIVGAEGRLTGYAGGLPGKRFLLDLESRVAGHPGRLF